MKYLKFDVNGMQLTKSKNTDLSNLIAGSKGYLSAMFNFSSDWHGMRKACVWVAGNRETPVRVEFNVAKMDDFTSSKNNIGLYIVGQNKDGTERLQTNTFWFTQSTGGALNGKR